MDDAAMDRLLKLKGLMDSGALTAEEFAAQKTAILNAPAQGSQVVGMVQSGMTQQLGMPPMSVPQVSPSFCTITITKPTADAKSGITIVNLPHDRRPGVAVEALVPGGLAAEAGFTVGDEIATINGIAPNSHEDATRLLKEKRVVEIVLKPKGVTHQPMMLAQQPVQPMMPAQQPGMVQPVQPMMPGQFMPRLPPPGCPPGGEYKIVLFVGPQTEQTANCLALTGCLFMGAFGAGFLCCILGECARCDPKDEKEVYALGGQYYTLNGTIDTKVVRPK